MSSLKDAKTSRLGLHLLSVPSQIGPQTQYIDIKKKSTELCPVLLEQVLPS